MLSLDQATHKAREVLDKARLETAGWIDEAKDVAADWRVKVDTTVLRARADRSERYAKAVLVLALASVDEAEKVRTKGLNAPYAEITFDFVLHAESDVAPGTVVNRAHAPAG